MRLFIAINFTDEIKDALCEATADLRDAALHGRYTSRDNLHLTLVFIGESGRADDIIEIMESVCEEAFAEPLRIAFCGAGAFRGKRGDTHWIGVENTPELRKLAAALASGLRREGFTIERRKFTPHITIGREVTLPEGARVSVPMAGMDAESISLMRSDRAAGRPVYTEIASAGPGEHRAV
jgi:2'-5' RNA ligase